MPSGEHLVVGLLWFVLGGAAVALGGLLIGNIFRRKLPHPDKGVPYECGEPTIGPCLVQFDLRFYVVALVFLIFDIEVALFYPWAVVYQEGGVAALWDMLFFFLVIVVGFLYLWRFGYLDWVRAAPELQAHEPGAQSADTMGRAVREWT